MVLYPDDPTHVACIDLLKSSGYSFAAILHDKDTYLESECTPDNGHTPGELKKPHWHVVLRLTNARWRDGIADELGIKHNYLEVCRNRDNALLYLVHEGFNDRYQYDVSDVFGSLTPNLEKLLVSDDEGERVLTIVHMIDQSPGRVTYREILVKVCKSGLYGDFRKLGSGAKWLIDEHNDDFRGDITPGQLPPDWEQIKQTTKKCSMV